MSFDPESILRPLRQRATDVAALRAGAASSAVIVRVARAAETTLRRMLRDDPTAPVELRLRALSEDDLPTADLLAELRRRNRLPVELAAGVHALDGARARIADGAEATEEDARQAAAVAQGIEAHVLALPAAGRLEDPVLDDPDEEALTADDEELVRAVPLSRRHRRVPWVTLGVLGALVVLLVVVIRMRGDDQRLREGEAAYRAGRVVQAEAAFRDHAEDHPRDPRPRIYLARIYREAGRLDDAERELRAGLEATPGDAGVLTERGYLLLDAGRPVDAEPVFREAVLTDPQSRRAWAGLVRALRAAGRPVDAEQVLEKAPADLRALVRTADQRDTAVSPPAPPAP